MDKTVFGAPLDLAALGILAGVLILFGITGGRRFLVSFLVSLYAAQGIVSVLPSLRTFLLRFGATLPSQVSAATFLIAVGFATWFISGSAVTGLVRFSGGRVRVWWQVFLAGLLGTGLFAAFFFPHLPKGTIAPSLILSQWVLVDPFPFLWAVAPIVFFVFLRKSDD